MKLISINEFLDRYFDPKSRPTDRAVRNWCRDGKLPSKQIGSLWYIDAEQFEGEDDAELIQRVLAA